MYNVFIRQLTRVLQNTPYWRMRDRDESPGVAQPHLNPPSFFRTPYWRMVDEKTNSLWFEVMATQATAGAAVPTRFRLDRPVRHPLPTICLPPPPHHHHLTSASRPSTILISCSMPADPIRASRALVFATASSSRDADTRVAPAAATSALTINSV